MNPRVFLFISLALATGFLLGWYLRGPSEASAALSELQESTLRTAPPSRASDGGNPSRMREAGSRKADWLEDENAEEMILVSPESVGSLIGARITRLEERKELVSLDQPLEKFINLTSGEAATLNEFWRRLKPELDALRMSKVKHQELNDGGVWLGITPFSESGEPHRQDVLTTIHQILGETRSRIFLEAIGAHQAFGRWGKTVGSGFTIHAFEQEDGSLIYEIIEQAAGSDGSDRKWNTSSLPAHLAEMAKVAGVNFSR